MGGGPDALVGDGRLEGIGSRAYEAVGRPVFPVQEADGAAVDEGDLMCIPCDEEEQAEMPLVLPSVYQPTQSEYMDHCVTLSLIHI